MPTRRLYTGRARPLFLTEGLDNTQAEAVITQLGYDINSCEKIQNLWYLVIGDTYMEVSIDVGVPDLISAELLRDGDYKYTVMANSTGANREGQLTAAFAQADTKVAERYSN